MVPQVQHTEETQKDNSTVVKESIIFNNVIETKILRMIQQDAKWNGFGGFFLFFFSTVGFNLLSLWYVTFLFLVRLL